MAHPHIIPKGYSVLVTVRDHQKVVFSGKAEALSSYNEYGLFDILPLHMNFISMIRDELVLHSPSVPDTHIPITTGVLRVKNNTVDVYVGLGIYSQFS